MRRILICTGILGGGTALTFAAAALAATLLPAGTLLPSSQNSVMWEKREVIAPDVAPVPMPVESQDVGISFDRLDPAP